MRPFSIALLALALLTGCSQQSSQNNAQVPDASSSGGGSSILSSLRAKADPEVLAKMKAEQEAQQQQQALAAQQGQAQPFGADASTSASVSLPEVSSSPFAPPAESVLPNGPVITPAESKPAEQPPSFPFWPFGGGAPAAPPGGAPPGAPPVASYGGYGGGAIPPPPPGGVGGLVPPPPAVSLSTSAQTMPYGGMPMDPYANPYAQAPQAAPAAPSRPALFSSGQRSADSGDDTPAPRRKNANFVPITPTGMESRSAYKQRDDLKVLWKGALASSSLQSLANRDEKIAASLARVDVGLPTESTKGSFNVSQRQIDAIFKPTDVDRRIAPQLKKLESDLSQSYYRYLYAYNKFALAQQTVAARKQEVEVAGTASEQQRAAADLAQAQSEAEAVKEDMRSAQYELSSVAGAQAARVIIGKVSGVAPSAESLASAETSAPAAAAPAAGKVGGFLGGMFKFGGGGGGAAPPAKVADAPKPAKVKGKKGAPGEDLAPAPREVASVMPERKEPAAEAPSASGSPVAFELKNVNITPRKSILKVSIRNNGSDSFSFDPDVISISEGNKKLSEATVRAEFDSTLVQPNQEVAGTITIFGRPWNDRLSVSLPDGGKNIQLRR